MRNVASIFVIAAAIEALWACGTGGNGSSANGNDNGGDGSSASGAGNGSPNESSASSSSGDGVGASASSPSGVSSGGSSNSVSTGGSSIGASVGDAGSSTSKDASVGAKDAASGASDGSTHASTDAASSGGSSLTVADAASGSAPGMPYKGVANSACGDLTTLGVSWYYNWELSPGSCTVSQFVPMIWGHTSSPTEQTAAGITSEINTIISGGYATVLGFNEPDNSSQSDIDVATAISLWPSFNNPALRIGSPATQANSTGQAWFTSFMDQVNADTTGTLRVDFITAHWYGWNSGSCDAKASTLESYIKYLEGIPGNRPIWLTEWGCLNDSNPSEAVVQAFFSGALTMLAKHPRVERYAWYPWETNNELVGDGGLTSLGEVFAAAPSTH